MISPIFLGIQKILEIQSSDTNQIKKSKRVFNVYYYKWQ